MEGRTLSQRRRSPQSHPFCQADRNHFPGLDKVFASGKDFDRTSSLSSSHASSSALASSLDMSIGARAAMTEHLRHIATYGLDGQPAAGSDFFTPTPSRTHSRTPSRTPTRTPSRTPSRHKAADEVWDRLMDGSSGNSSMLSSSSPNYWMYQLEPVVSVTSDGSEAVELAAPSTAGTATDVSDFFNSSRVWQLETPERHANVIRTVTSARGQYEHVFSDDDEDDHTSSGGMLHLYNAAMGMRMHDTSESHASESFLSGVDLSRIASDLSDIRPSPNGSFATGARNTSMDDDTREFLSRIDMSTPSRRKALRDLSYSTPARRTSGAPLFTPPSRKAREKENASNLSEIGLSPIAARAGSMAVKLLGGKSSRRAQDHALTKQMEQLCIGPNSSPISHASEILPVDEDCILDMDSSYMSAGLSPRSSIYKQNGSPTSTTTSTNASPSSGEDRRRYRTVVPSRVFMDEPQSFPMQNDSFAVETSSSSSSSQELPAKSLLVSFEAADTGVEVLEEYVE